jgi:hypothetical protein
MAVAAATLATLTITSLVIPSIAGAQTPTAASHTAASHTAASHTAASHTAQAGTDTHASVVPHLAPNIVVGDNYCGTGSVTPSTGVKGGTPLTVNVKWEGSPTNKKCLMPTTNCGSSYFGSCNAGYWVIGIFCNPLAAINLAKGQADCDLNNIVVLTDNNRGPNNPTDSHGTSYNQCTTVQSLGSIFGGLPGTLYCVADNQNSDGWSESWLLGSQFGRAKGPAEATGSTTPFKPANAGIDCPPSAANIKAGALPGFCAFTILPVAFQYYCVFTCVPDTSLPNDGSTELSADHLGILFQYAKAPK